LEVSSDSIHFENGAKSRGNNVATLTLGGMKNEKANSGIFVNGRMQSRGTVCHGHITRR
jgi:hypothetical protein